MSRLKYPKFQSLDLPSELFNKILFGGHVKAIEELLNKFQAYRASYSSNETFINMIVTVEELIRKYPKLHVPTLSNYSFVKMLTTITNFNENEMEFFNDIMTKYQEITLVNLPCDKILELIAKVNKFSKVEEVIHTFPEVSTFRCIKIIELIFGSPIDANQILALVREFPQLFYANLSADLYVKMIIAISKFNYQESIFFHSVRFQFDVANSQHEQIAELIINIPHALKIEGIMVKYPELVNTKTSDESYVKMIIAISKFNAKANEIFNYTMGKYKEINIPYKQIVELIINIPNYSYHIFAHFLDILIEKCKEPISEKRNDETLGIVKRMSCIFNFNENSKSIDTEDEPLIQNVETIKTPIKIVTENKTSNELDNKKPIVIESKSVIQNVETVKTPIDSNKTPNPIVEIKQNVTNKDTVKQNNPNNIKIDVQNNGDKLEIFKLKNQVKSLSDKLNQCLKCIRKNDDMIFDLQNDLDEKDDEIDYLKLKVKLLEDNEIENIKSFGKIINNMNASLEMKQNKINYLEQEETTNVD